MELMPQAEDALLLWVRNGHEHDGDLGICLGIGSADDHGGLIHLSDGGGVAFTEAFLTYCSTSIEGRGSISTPGSPRSDDRKNLVPYPSRWHTSMLVTKLGYNSRLRPTLLMEMDWSNLRMHNVVI